MKISNVEVYGLEQSIRASKLPMSTSPDDLTSQVTETVKKLSRASPGSGHDQFLTGIIVQFDLTISLKMWTEMQRYHFVDFVSSQSTMHRIAKFKLEDQVNEYVDKGILDILNAKIKIYNENPTPENYLHILYNIPTGFELTARLTTNYRELKTQYYQRRNHRLPEWKEYCQWIETLPESYLIIGQQNA